MGKKISKNQKFPQNIQKNYSKELKISTKCQLKKFWKVIKYQGKNNLKKCKISTKCLVKKLKWLTKILEKTKNFQIAAKNLER